MNQRLMTASGTTLPPLYTGMIDCAVKVVKHEGFFTLYRGFFLIWGRMVSRICVLKVCNNVPNLFILFRLPGPWRSGSPTRKCVSTQAPEDFENLQPVLALQFLPFLIHS